MGKPTSILPVFASLLSETFSKESTGEGVAFEKRPGQCTKNFRDETRCTC